MRYWIGVLAAVAAGIVCVGAIVYHLLVPTPKLPPTIQWGLFSGGPSDVRTTTEELGKQPNIVVKFVGFFDQFPYNFASTCTKGQTLLVYWENTGEPYSVDRINAGRLDAYIHSFAQEAARDKCSVVLAPFHEMNGDWTPWSGAKNPNSPTKLITAWRHIHDIFANEAPNVRFAWVMNAGSFPDIPGNQLVDYYPGDAYVDWVGLDGFNFNRGGVWQTLAEIYDDPVRQIQIFNKPICICSVGSAPGPKQAEWVRQGFAHIGTYQHVVAVVYFNAIGDGVNWRIDHDPSTLDAFKSVLP